MVYEDNYKILYLKLLANSTAELLISMKELQLLHDLRMPLSMIIDDHDITQCYSGCIFGGCNFKAAATLNFYDHSLNLANLTFKAPMWPVAS